MTVIEFTSDIKRELVDICLYRVEQFDKLVLN